MKKYMFLYFGGAVPEDDEARKAMSAEWAEYYKKLGERLVDGGAPFAEGSKVVGGDKKSGGAGYTIVTAESMDDAILLTTGHPHIAGGGSIEILEFAPM